MIVVERTFTVTASPGAALGYLSDFAHTEQWDSAVERTVRTGTGPVAPGATWHQTCRIFGVSTELIWTLVAMDPGSLVFHGRNEGATCTETVLVRPAGAGSEVVYRVEAEMHGLAKLATPVLKIEFEKLGTTSVAALTDALDRLTPGRATELHFPALPPNTVRPPTVAQPREAQA